MHSRRHSRTHTKWLALGAVVAGLAQSAGCDGPCPSGSIQTTEGRCVAIDGGLIDGGLSDGSLVDSNIPVDAASCGESELRCDGRDDDCDGRTDEGLLTAYFRDADSDSYGLMSDRMESCQQVSGYVTVSGDCDDTSAARRPTATETCDALDNDCDGQTDETVGMVFYADADGDTFGDPAMVITRCTAPSGYVANSMDCNDTCSGCRPGGTEVCDQLDNDCDELVDEGTQVTFFRDADGDGFGVSTMTMLACWAPMGYAATGDDCNDSCSGCRPSGTEFCDMLDNDCDTRVDEGVQTTFYWDFDYDGFGDPAITMLACTRPDRWAPQSGDCNLVDANQSPGNTESCDEVDNDCDTRTDEGIPRSVAIYPDCDSDGFARSGATMDTACRVPANRRPPSCTSSGRYTGVAPATQGTTDCHDADARAFPGQTMYFSTARPDGSYDFDCNGLASQETPGVGGSCTGSFGNCRQTSTGWQGSVPACGGTGNLAGCALNCQVTYFTTQHACR